MALPHQDPRKERALNEGLSTWHAFTLFVGRFYWIHYLFTEACCGEKSLQMLLGCLTGVDKLSGKKHNASSMFSGLPWKNQTCGHVSPGQGPPLPCPWYQGQESGPMFKAQVEEGVSPRSTQKSCIFTARRGLYQWGTCCRKSRVFWIQSNTGLDLDSTTYKPHEVGQIT